MFLLVNLFCYILSSIFAKCCNFFNSPIFVLLFKNFIEASVKLRTRKRGDDLAFTVPD
jgi:hypothetical protein